ncbi:AAA family ATPase [Desulfosudis oleivorans]|uniref:ATP-binding region ATPase domain protein n=1 Tax=Desulfosudis oleivorans (strain DSM 6200 / JCM 39069 / Hxd3) TaxID=96561 RepID=A8ZRS3_DESOH|nr:AAA family ATPase [Desulfosudis oleivorans]ABW65840.1 ATP-binding region ATPase domain protein [Desulfosudis oleivorans Hxd3]
MAHPLGDIARQALAHRYDRLVEMDATGTSTTLSAVDRDTGRAVVARLLGVETRFPAAGTLLDHVARLASLSSDYLLEIYEYREVPADSPSGILVIHEAFTGMPLGDLLPSFHRMLSEDARPGHAFCVLAAQMATALRDLHAAGLLYRGITPHSFLFNPATRRFKLDGLAWDDAWLPEQGGFSAGVAASALSCLAPEQAGRMDHVVDFRANLYSLGVLFYEMMTGKHPFPAGDAAGVLYGHTARTPALPSDLNPAMDTALSRMVLKLLAKHPDDRYQSAAGLLFDLADLTGRFDAALSVGEFMPGRKDVSPVFALPDRLYGREEALSFLKKRFDRVRAGDTGVVMVTGGTGVGKTEVIRHLSRYVRESGGIFLTGKFDPNQQNVPLSASKTAIASIARWLLSRPPDQIRAWREKILSAVWPSGQVLVDMIPEMELIIGKQPPLGELPPMEANMRMALVMEKFGTLFLAREHPVVFFLDDLQWADRGTLEHGVAFMLIRQRHYCMVLGTCRDSEVDDTHPLSRFLEKLERTSVPVEKLSLRPLDIDQTTAMMADTLSQARTAVLPLARIVFEKTGGNPFFIRQFLGSLHANGLIHYDTGRGCWAWNVERIAAADITDNVARLLSTTIDKLPAPTLSVLQAAACAGNRIDPELLVLVIGRDRADICAHVQTALEAGLVHPVTDPSATAPAVDTSTGLTWEFAHDHILQAVYQTLPETQAREIHWTVGKALLEKASEGAPGERIFDIVHQLRLGMPLSLSSPEATELARLNLEAGRVAMETISFEGAADYLRHACNLLPDTAWETHYDLAAGIYGALARCEFALGAFVESERLFGLLLQKAPSLVTRARAYNAMVELHTAAGNIDKALMLGRRALETLGIHLPRRPGRARVLLLLVRLRLIWGVRRVSAILDAAENRDETLDITLTLLTNIGLPTFYVNPLLCLWINATGILLGIRNPKEGFPLQHASFGLITLGAFLGSIFGFIGMGRHYAKTGMRLLERQAPGQYQAIAYFVSAFFNRHWYQPARKSIDSFKRAYRHALKTGDISYAGHSINSMFMVRFFLGDNLDAVYAYHQRHEAFIQKARSPFAVAHYKLLRQLYRSLKGQALSPAGLDTKDYDTAAEFAAVVDTGNLLLRFFFLLSQLKLYVFHRQWENGASLVERIQAMNYLPVGTLVVTEYCFFAFLSITNLIVAGTPPQQARRYSRRAARFIRRMRQWYRLQPDNFEPMLRLMEAEKARVQGRPVQAQERYRQAVAAARDGGFTHLAALGCESAGNFFAAQGDTVAARAYLAEARKAYLDWGATAKAADLEKQHAGLFAAIPGHTAVSISPLERADHGAVVAALQAVSQEIVVRRLLTRLMEITMAATGASRAAFISNRQGRLFVEVERWGNETDQTLLKSEPLLEQPTSLMAAVVYYVKRTRELVVMNDVKKESSLFQKNSDDAGTPRALVCMPMARNKRLVGILYLENALTGGVFTEDRIGLLTMIASQAAVSFENATLYEHVMKNEQDLKRLSEKLRSLYSELLLTEERERRRIATELHDRIGHALAGAKIGLETLCKGSAKEHEARLRDVLAVLDQSIADTRTLTFELSPPILYHLGLGPALDWLCEETQKKHGLTVSFADTGQEGGLDQKTEILCFQIVRELLFNAVKHSQAGHVEVRLYRNGARMGLTIQDDGVGFDGSRQSAGSGFGLFSIHERLRLVGGEMNIDTGKNRGTTIDITVPLTGENQNQGEVNDQGSGG